MTIHRRRKLPIPGIPNFRDNPRSFTCQQFTAVSQVLHLLAIYNRLITQSVSRHLERKTRYCLMQKSIEGVWTMKQVLSVVKPGPSSGSLVQRPVQILFCSSKCFPVDPHSLTLGPRESRSLGLQLLCRIIWTPVLPVAWSPGDPFRSRRVW